MNHWRDLWNRWRVLGLLTVLAVVATAVVAALPAVSAQPLGDLEVLLPDTEGTLPQEQELLPEGQGLLDLAPEEIDGHELGAQPPPPASIGELLSDDGLFEWEDASGQTSLALLGSQGAAAFGGDAAVGSSTLSGFASAAAVGYAPPRDSSSNETSTVQRAQEQADNWFVSDTGQLFLSVGGVLVLFSADIAAADARAVLLDNGVDTGRVLPIEGLPNGFNIATSSDAESLQLVKLLADAPGVESVTLNMFTPDTTGDTESVPQATAYNPLDAATKTLCKSNDPPLSDELSACLWHLDASKAVSVGGNKPTTDINIGKVWDTTKGAGVTVSVVDATWEAGHEDLAGNANKAASTYWGGHTGENGKNSPYHGTVVAGIIGARDNTLGGRGVAPRASLQNVNYIDYQSIYTASRAFLHNKDTVAVANHSYGRIDTGRLSRWSPIVVAALEESLESGFGGKGTVHVKSAGNGKNDGIGDEASLDESGNHRGLIIACAVNSAGTDTAYSEEGSNVWICGPSGDSGRHGMLAPIGTNQYHSNLRGTSYSAPVVSGVAALMRSVNSALTWRDVKVILANTAQKNASSDSSWQAGALKYGSTTDSYSYSRKYGFGLVDASAAVTAAQSWTALPPMFSGSASSSGSWDVTSTGTAKEFSLNLTSDISFVEHVDVNINMNTSHFRALQLTLVSPSGRESLLVNSSLALGRKCNCPLNGSFRFGSVRHLGESASGTWKLKVKNVTGVPATLNSWGVTVWGHNPSKTNVVTLSVPLRVAEGNNFQIKVTHRGTALTSDLVVPVVLKPLNATPPGQVGADYTALTSITIPAGQSSASGTVSLTDDDIVEPTEVVFASVGSMPNPYTSDSVSKMVRILDNDKPEVSVRAVNGSVNEGEDVVFEVTVHDDPIGDFAVFFQVSEPQQPAVYMDPRQLTNGAATFGLRFSSAGTATVPVLTVLDQIDEPRRLVAGQILSSSLYDIRGNHSAQVWVDDDLHRVSIASDGNINEGGTASFTLKAVPVPTSSLSVKVSVAETGYFGVDTADRTVAIDSTGTAKLSVPTTRHVFGQPAGAIKATVQPPGDGTYYPSPGSGQDAATVSVKDLDDTDLSAKSSVVGIVKRRLSQPFIQFFSALVNRWNRVLLAFGENPSGVTGGPMTAAEAKSFATGGAAADWRTVAAELERLDAARSTEPVVIVTADGAITEGDNASFTLRALPGPVSDLDVEVTVAAEGSFSATTGTRTVTIPAKGTATLTVATGHDGIDGRDGSVTVTVVDGTAYSVYSKPSAKVDVADSGGTTATPVVSITADPDITEGDNVRFVVTASPIPSAPLSVDVNMTVLGDFGVLPASFRLTIPSSGTAAGRATLSATTTNDTVDEPNGSVTATLVSGTGYVVSSLASAATVNVADNDDPPVPVVGVVGGGSITEGANAVFSLTAVPAPSVALSVDVTVTVTGDYGVSAGSRTVTVGTNGSGTLTLATVGDNVDEADGSVTVTLVDGAAYDLDGTASSAIVSVADDDDPPPPPPVIPVVGVVGGGSITEGANAVFSLTAVPAPSVALSVDVTVTVTGDYGVSAGSRTVTVGTNGSGTLTLATAGDNVDEVDGSVTVTLVDGAAYDLDGTASSAIVSVADDDDPPPVVPCVVAAPSDSLVQSVRGYHNLNRSRSGYNQNWLRVLIAFGVETSTTLQPFTAAEARVGEQVWDGWTPVRQELERIEREKAQCTPQTPVTPVVSVVGGGSITEGANVVFSLTAVPAPSVALSVDVTVTVTGDYGVSAGSRTVTVGTNGSGTLTLATVGDNVDEADGSVTVTLVDGAAYDLNSNASATVNVADDDDPPPPPPVIPVVGVVGGGSITEGANAVFSLTAVPAPSVALSVDVTVTVTGDYGVSAGSRTVTVGTNGSGTLTLATAGDNVDEVDGSVTVTLVDGAAYDLDGTASSAIVSVADDDDPPPVVPCVVAAPSDSLVQSVRGYHNLNRSRSGYNQNWLRVLIAFGVETSTTLQPFTAAEARVGEQVWDGWTPVRQELERIEREKAQCTPQTPVTPVVSVVGGGSITEGANAVFSLTAVPAPSVALSVDVTVTVTGDYGVSAGSRTVTVGTNGSGTLTLATVGDNVDEADGSVTVTLVDGAAYDLNSNASATVNVADDDDPPPPPPVIPVVGVVGGGSITEGANAVFSLTAVPAPSVALSVDVTVTVTGDYGVSAGSRTVTVGTNGSGTLTLATAGDNVDEVDGSVTVTLVDGAAYDLDGTASSAIVSVADDDDPPPVVPCVVAAPSDSLVQSVRGYHNLNRSRSGYNQNWLRVLIAFGVETSTTLQPFTAAEARVGEQVWDGWTPVRQELERIEREKAQCTPQTPVTPVVSVVGGGSITEGANAVFSLTAVPAPSVALSVDVTVTVTGDYGVSAGSRTVTVGTNGSGTLTLATVGDNVDEADGSVTVTLVDGAAYDLNSNASATVNVADDDDPPPPPPVIPVVGVVGGGSITEGANAVFSLTAVPAPSVALSVDVTVTVTGDYGVSAGSRTVTVGTNGSGTLTLATVGDTADEADGSVTVTLVDGAAYNLNSNASATVNVADDDDPPPPPPVIPVVGVVGGGSITEGANAVFTLTAVPAPSAAFDVDVTVTVTGDYGVTAGTRTVTVGTNGSGTLTLATAGDTADEADGSVTVTLVDGAAYNLNSNASATVNVADDDDPPPPPPPPPPSQSDKPVVTLEKTNAVVTEGENAPYGFTRYHIYISLDKPVSHPVSVLVGYQTTGSGAGHASLNSDFNFLSYRVTIFPGLTRNRMGVMIWDDKVKEPDETLRLFISAPQGATIKNSQTILTIKDND